MPTRPGGQPERRQHLRAIPDKRLVVSIEGGSVRVADLSRGGLTLHGPRLETGTLVHIDMHLGKSHLSARVKILRNSDDLLSHGSFVELDPQQQRALQDYVDSL